MLATANITSVPHSQYEAIGSDVGNKSSNQNSDQADQTEQPSSWWQDYEEESKDYYGIYENPSETSYSW